MNQYLITAHDGDDENALERRMAARPAHLALVKALKDSGNFVMGGAHLSEANTMKGSTMVVQFESEKELQEYLAKEPYIEQGVWKSYTIMPFKVADV